MIQSRNSRHSCQYHQPCFRVRSPCWTPGAQWPNAWRPWRDYNVRAQGGLAVHLQSFSTWWRSIWIVLNGLNEHIALSAVFQTPVWFMLYERLTVPYYSVHTGDHRSPLLGDPINQSVLKDERGVLNTACASKRGHLETCWWVKWWSTSGWYGAPYFQRNPNGSKGHGYGSSSNILKIHATNIVVDLKLFCILFGDSYISICHVCGSRDPMIATSCSQTVRPSIFRRIGSKRIDSKK